MPWDAIIFDLDGTLWDATHVTAHTWTYVLADHPELQRTVDLATVQQGMGFTNEEIAVRLFPEMPFEKSFGLVMESCAWENRLLREQGGTLYPAVIEVLEKLSVSSPLAIVSNCQSGYVEAFLEYHKTNRFFTDHTCSGDTGLPKADNIRLICRRNGYKRPVYVGDTIGDSLAAREAGCGFLFASYGFGQVPAEQCDGILTCPADIFRFI